ncbi:hypothetical protein AeMF1_006340 [Aphanomyces euteiches]|nr:hypothetical protein AeMF1_006340 [Aphanomyces euteiches]
MAPERRPSSEYGRCAACEDAAKHDHLMEISQPWNPLRRPSWQAAVVTSVAGLVLFLANQLTTLLVGFYPIYAQQTLRATNFHISALFSIYPLCIMIGCPMGSFLTTRLGRQAILCLGLFISGIATIAFAYVENINVLVGIRAIQGIGAGLSIVGSMSMIADQLAMNVGRAISISELVVAVAYITAPAIGSLLFACGGIALPFLVSGLAQLGCLMILPSLFMEYGLPDGLAFSVDRPGAEPTTPLHFGDVLTPVAVVCLVVTAATMGGFGLIDPTLGSHLEHSLGAQHTAIGIGFSVSALVYYVGDYFFSYITMKCGCKPTILAGLAGLSLSFLLLGIPSIVLAPSHNDGSYALWSVDGVALILMGCGAALAIAPGVPLSLASHDGTKIKEARPLMIGLFGCAVYLGQAVGPWLAWSLAHVVPEAHSSPLPWVFTVYGIVLVCVWLYVLLLLPSGEDIQAKTYRKSFSLQRQVSEYGHFVVMDDDDEDMDDGAFWDDNNGALGLVGYGSMMDSRQDSSEAKGFVCQPPAKTGGDWRCGPPPST